VTWLSTLIAEIITRLASILVAEALKRAEETQVRMQNARDIDGRLDAFKNAYREAFNGEKITPEQDEKLKASISDFIRGGM
jgi:hypothetical protein